MKPPDHYQRWLEACPEIAKQAGSKIDLRLVYSHTRPTFFREELRRVPGTDLLEPGLTRLGWLPDLPPDMEWPQHQGKALDFLAQVNLADLEPHFHPALPERGWLYFFAREFQDEKIIPHRVLYFDGPVAALTRATRPSHLAPPEQVNPQTALFGLRSGFTTDPVFLDQIAGYFQDNSNFLAYEPLLEPLQDQSPDITRLGGYPYAFQGGGQDRHALLYLNDFEALVKHGWFDPLPWLTSVEQREKYHQQRIDAVVRAGDWERLQVEVERYNRLEAELEKHIQPIEMLFGLESVLGREWGDMGFLEFFIRQDDLARHDFSRTFCDVLSN
jgi:hypothetical protein